MQKILNLAQMESSKFPSSYLEDLFFLCAFSSILPLFFFYLCISLFPLFSFRLNLILLSLHNAVFSPLHDYQVIQASVRALPKLSNLISFHAFKMTQIQQTSFLSLSRP